jgi:hypothetical protein
MCTCKAFDIVWHTGLLYKLGRSLNYFPFPKSYLHSRYCLVKIETEYTELSPLNAGVHKRSVLGALLYLLYTADQLTSPESTTATFADDTELVATDSDPAIAPHKLQTNYLQSKTGLRNGEWKLTDPSRSKWRLLHEEKRALLRPYKQCATPPRRRCQVSRSTPWQETYLVQTYFRKTETTRNHPHQNVLVTRTQVKTLYKQQTSHT